MVMMVLLLVVLLLLLVLLLLFLLFLSFFIIISHTHRVVANTCMTKKETNTLTVLTTYAQLVTAIPKL